MTTPAPTSVLPTTFAGAQAVLATRLPGYRRRPQQEWLAGAIEIVLETVGQDEGFAHLLAQAGTGTGKSLAAAIPAILSGGRIILVTTTIALMNQYIHSDLPFLEANLGVPFTWAPLKGLSNFLCKAKLDQRPDIPQLDALLMEITVPDGAPQHTGDRDDITVPMITAQWREVSSTTEECPGKSKCPLAASCYGMLHKEAAAGVDIVVTNAAMLLTDVKVNKTIRDRMAVPADTHPVIGSYKALIIDEAHELVDIATDFLGESLSQGGIMKFVEQASSFVNLHLHTRDEDGEESGAGLARLREAGILEERIAGHLSAIGEIVLAHLGKKDKTAVDKSFIGQHIEVFAEFYDALHQMVTLAKDTEIDKGSKEDQKEKQQLLVKTGQNHLDELKTILLAEDDEVARWAETYTVKGRHRPDVKRWAIKTAPIDVAPILQAELWSKVPAVLMSATLATGRGTDRFGYMGRALGLEGAITLDVGSPFDYAKQAMLYYPGREAPSPAPETREAWAAYAPEATLGLVRAAGGGAMLLYTSRTAMKAAHDMIGDRLRADGLTTFLQGGDLTNKEIAQRFREDEDSVLFGLRSFMTGMDFPGRTNRLVVIDKLPFPVPTEPVFEARTRAIENRRGDAFNELSVPMMTLVLQQAFGRLIRTVDDWGMVAILDPRLATKPYGRRIVAALPDAVTTSSIDEVRAFFDSWNSRTS